MNKRFLLLLAGLLTLTLLVAALSHIGFAKGAASVYQYRRHSDHLTQLSNQGLYAPDPTHLWNRIYRHFYVRTDREGKEFGYDELDPLLWWETKHLTRGISHQQALKLLEQFLSTHGEKLIDDPLKRALFQRDLWALFDWLNQVSAQQNGSEELQKRLVLTIRRLALTQDQIRLLPDNYAAAVTAKSFPSDYQPGRPDLAFFPADLLQAAGSWVCVGSENGRHAAPTHVQSLAFAGRSTFLVFIRLPEGRKATLDYLKKLNDFSHPWILDPDRSSPERVVPNPEVPQFPRGTQVALVRRMVLIDNQGKLMPTLLTESVQIRVYHSVPEGVSVDRKEARAAQKNTEFRLSRRKLFDGEAGGLRAVLEGEKLFPVFMTHGNDSFELAGEPVERFQVRELNSCSNCHADSGIHSVLSYSGQRFLNVFLYRPTLVPSIIANEESLTIDWKRHRYEWGWLKGLWQATKD